MNEKPYIARQLDGLAEDVRRLLVGENRGVLCFGPAGMGKSVTVETVLTDAKVPYIKPNNATKYGVYALLRANREAILWLDDFDDWLYEIELLNLFKAIMDKRRSARIFKSFNRDTIRQGFSTVESNTRLVITSNTDPAVLPTKVRNQILAIEDRCARADISHDLADRLEYIDWMVCENDYFRSPLLHRIERIPPLSLREIQDVLDWIHANARYLRLSLRLLNDVARERKLHADGWQMNMERRLLPQPQAADIDTNAPRVQGWNRRHGKDDTSRQPQTRTAAQPEPQPESVAAQPRMVSRRGCGPHR